MFVHLLRYLIRIVRVDAETGKTRKVFDTISDNAANAGVVLGPQKHKISAFDLRWVGAITSRNNEVKRRDWALVC